MTIEVLCRLAPWSSRVEFVVRDTASRAIALPLTFDSKPEQGALVQPTMALENEEAQALMDELWRTGFRPAEGTGSAGSLRATERHLEDMRKLALDLVADKLSKATS